MNAVFLLVLFLVLVAVGLPIAFSFGAGSLLFFLSTGSPFVILVSRAFGQIDSFALMAIPFFILCGDLMREGGVSRAIVDFIYSFIGRVRGVLAQVTIVASAFFGAITGSGPATVAAIGGLMIPEMIRHKYDPRFASVCAGSAGYLGILIPPSIPLIIYGLNAQVSVGALFLAGTIPGILTALGFMVVNYFTVNKYKEKDSEEEAIEKFNWSYRVKTTKRASLAIIMPFIILGGIYAGIFTPTEAGAVAAIYGFIVSYYYYKGINRKNLMSTLGASAINSGIILILIAFAGVFGWIITTQQVPTIISDSMLSLTENPIIIMLLINVFLLLLGMVMETVAAILVTTPILLPIATHVGVDPVHFGVILIYNLGVGMMTPPMAVNLLMASRISNIEVVAMIKPLIPFFLCAIIMLFLVTYCPMLSLWLPSILL